MTKILRIDASQRREGSASRALTDALIATLDPGGDAEIVHLDLAETSIPPLTAEWIEARTVAPEDQTERQQEALSGSDALIAALREADILVIGSPLYNFAIPAPLQAWIDSADPTDPTLGDQRFRLEVWTTTLTRIRKIEAMMANQQRKP